MTQDQVRDGTTRNVGFVFVSALITQASLLVLYLILARILPVEEFATFRQLFLIQSILNGIFFAALPTCLLYFTGRADSDGEKKGLSASRCDTHDDNLILFNSNTVTRLG